MNKIYLYLIYITSIILTFIIIKLNLNTNIQIYFLIITIIINITLTLFSKKQYKYVKLICIFYISINIILSLISYKSYNYIENLRKKIDVYSSTLYSNNEAITNINDCTNVKIGILKTNNEYQNEITYNLINNNNLNNNANNLTEFQEFDEMINLFKNNKLDLIIIPENFKELLENTNFYKITEIEEEKTTYIESSGKNIKESFTLLLIGVDSEKDGNINESSNGDSLILITFNPKTLNATMLSIPRDSYVPIQCFKNKRENKITHASWYGEKCIEETIENFLDVKIDYYVKINFKGVVSLIDELGGVYIDVPRNLCTDNSSRQNITCIEKGYQNLNGEQALTLARNRHDLPNGDFDRMDNQQLLLKSIINSLKNIKNINKIKNILDSIQKNLETNIGFNEIISLYDIYTDINKSLKYNNEPLQITKLNLYGESQTIYDEISHINHWNYILNNKSIEDVSNEMKNNLSNQILSEEFNFDIKKEYKKDIIGTGPYNNTKLYKLLPNFIGQNINDIENYINENKIKVIYKYKIDNENKYQNNTIIDQNYPQKTRIDKINTLEITISQKIDDINTDFIDNFIN